jgi:hypothetical protein
MADEKEMKAAQERLKLGKYINWTNAGGPNECAHGVAEALACRKCDEELVAKLPADASPSELQEQAWRELTEQELRFEPMPPVVRCVSCKSYQGVHKASCKGALRYEVPIASPTAAGSEEPKLKDDPLGIEFARRVAGAHTKLTQDLISSEAPVKPKRWSGLVSLVTAAGDSETNVTLEAPVASLAPAPKRPEPIQWVHLSKYSTTEYFLGSDATSYMDYLEGRVRELEAFAYRCIRELEYVQSLSGYDNGSLCASSEGRACVADGMKMIGVEMLGEETLDDERKTEANHE